VLVFPGVRDQRSSRTRFDALTRDVWPSFVCMTWEDTRGNREEAACLPVRGRGCEGHWIVCWTSGRGRLGSVAGPERGAALRRVVRHANDEVTRRVRYARGRLEGVRYRLVGRVPEFVASSPMCISV